MLKKLGLVAYHIDVAPFIVTVVCLLILFVDGLRGGYFEVELLSQHSDILDIVAGDVTSGIDPAMGDGQPESHPNRVSSQMKRTHRQQIRLVQRIETSLLVQGIDKEDFGTPALGVWTVKVDFVAIWFFLQIYGFLFHAPGV